MAKNPKSPAVADDGTDRNEPPDSVNTVTNNSKEVHIPDQEEYLGTEMLEPIPVGDHRVITRNRRGTMQALFTPKEAQEQLRVSMSTIRSWIHQGKLPMVRLGRRVLIQESVLEKIVTEGLEAVEGC